MASKIVLEQKKNVIMYLGSLTLQSQYQGDH